MFELDTPEKRFIKYWRIRLKNLAESSLDKKKETLEYVQRQGNEHSG